MKLPALPEFLARFEAYLKETLSDFGGELGDAMRYAVLDGGKRVRPCCVYLGARASSKDEDVDVDALIALASAVELIHNYSLVHDDMPEMDNDDFRRGKLSVHKKYGAATGLLVGDALLTLATRQLVKCDEGSANELSHAAMQMVVGQSAEFEGCNSAQDYLDMYSKKTGALICGAFMAGAKCVGANGDTLVKIKEFSKHLGLAFQLADDLLDEGDENSIISVIGVQETKKLLDEHSKAAIDVANSLQGSEQLIDFAQMLWRRTK